MMKVTLALVLTLAAMAAAQACSYSAPTVVTTGANLVTGDRLTFAVHSPSEDNADLSIFVNDFLTDGACDITANALPAGDITPWSVTLGTGAEGEKTCNVFTFDLELPVAIARCGFSENVGTDVTTFTTNLKFTNAYDNTDVFGTTSRRVDQSDRTVGITFQNDIVVAADVVVVPAAVTYGAFVSSDFNSDTGVVTFSLVTQGPNPYFLEYDSDPGTSSTNAGYTISGATSTDIGCSAAVDTGAGTASCQQTWTFTATPTDYCGAQTEADQAITVPFNIKCDAAFAGSCEDLENDAAAFTITVDTDDFCPQVVEVAEVTADIVTRSVSHSGTVSSSYTFGGTIYGTVQLAIPSGIQLASTVINTITVDNQCTGCTTQNIVVYTDAGTSLGNAAVETNNPADLFHTFEFDVTSDTVQFDGNAVTGTADIIITVDLTLTYKTAANQEVTKSMRTVIPSATGTAVGLSPSTQAGITTPGQASSSSTVLGVTQGTAIIAGVALAAVMALAVVAAVTIRRRQAGALAQKAQSGMSSSSVQLKTLEEDGSSQEIVGTDNLRMVQTAYDQA